jgi:hypothetical protein
MQNVKVKELTVNELNKLISNSVREAIEDVLEDLLALNNPEFIASIKNARADYKEGRVKSFKEVFENEL